MSSNSFDPEYEGGIPVFRPAYEDFRDFKHFVSRIEPIGMKTGIVKIIPPEEWISKLPRLATAEVDAIEIRNPIIQNITLGAGRGVFGIENVEKRKKYTIKQWVKQCSQLANQAPVRRGEKQRVLGALDATEGGFISYDDTDYSKDRLEYLETRFWKTMAYGGSPMYGADLPGSLFTEKTTEWNVAELDSLLSRLNEKIPGVNDAYLYCGMWKATFAWHVEDMDLPSINYIHFGAPKQWYTIPQSHHQQFYDLMTASWPKEQAQCSEFLRHKTFFADPSFIAKHGIPVNKIVHRQREFIITFPYGYHAGFNYGFNVAESVNFAHDSWLEIGVKAKSCTCVSHSVAINVQSLVDKIKASEADEHNKAAASASAAGAAATLKYESSRTPSAAKKPRRLGKCVLCPHVYKPEYLSNPEGTAKAHTICANLTPETFSAGQTVYGMPDIPRERFALKCNHCKLTLGSCFQCSVPKCTRAYHGSCAAAAGVDYSDVNRPLCRVHRPQVTTHFDASLLIPGDVVHYESPTTGMAAGLVDHVDREKELLHLYILPSASEPEIVAFSAVHSLSKETPQGPFIEPLPPKKKPRKSAPKSSTPPSTTAATLPSPPKQEYDKQISAVAEKTSGSAT